MKHSEARVQKLIEPTVQALGLQLWGIEQAVQGRFSVLRIYIENEEGITVDDCEKASRHISAILDVDNPAAGEYTLEVSSPGLDRPLFTPGQFSQFAGTKVRVRMRSLIQGRRKFTGLLSEVLEASIVMTVSGETVTLPFADIDKANVIYEDDDANQFNA
ncbi:MAG: ribosome maturation factor RimP [Gammaproteobacteria bacterium]|nr:ribosome maturation factor RimP [Gammaproteobacteria bacterium]